MSKEREGKAAKRRDFLRLAGVGTLGGAAAAAATVTPAEAAREPVEEAGGYRETAHVRKVYELARF